MSSSVFEQLGHVIGSRDPSVEQRRVQRDLVDLATHAKVRDATLPLRVINISALGLMCRTKETLLVGEHLTVWLPIIKDYPAEIRWSQDGRAGMEFLEPITPKIYDAMLSLIPPRQTAW
ncbi:PilZ domain-containing protein [Sphingobium sp.]|uniref:PilZ domain-containing protein n=1 Tax=Sphingobium sp. TaxID=1912891 RepID=UPI003B3A3322